MCLIFGLPDTVVSDETGPVCIKLSPTLGEQHVDATIFLPAVISRLQSQPDATFAEINVSLEGLETDTDHSVRIEWEESEIPQTKPAISETTLTEFAACGIACVLLTCFTGFRLSHVSRRGDRFDYWLRNGDCELGLEISGTLTQSLSERHREKVSQLLENPFGLDGYVCVVGFSKRRAILSFHCQQPSKLT